MDENANSQIALPVSSRQLGAFIGGLLGQRRIISQDYEHIFVMDIPWIYNLIELINQRVKSQNDAQLVSCSIDLEFDNGKIISLDNSEVLRSYNDITDNISTGIRVDLSYIIMFPYKEIPERQDIVFIARSKIDVSDRSDGAYRRFRNFLLPIHSDQSQLMAMIRYTDLTWGEDILNLITNHISSKFSKPSGLIEALKFSFAGLVPLISMILGFWTAFYEIAKNRNNVNNILLENSKLFEIVDGNIESINSKINVIYKAMHAQYSSVEVGGFLLIISMFSTMMLSLFLIRIKRKSYVVLNERTRINMNSSERNRKTIMSIIFVGFALSIFASLISSFIYDKIEWIWK